MVVSIYAYVSTGFGAAAKVEAAGREPCLNHEALDACGAVLFFKSAFGKFVESGDRAASAYLSAPPTHAFSGRRHTRSVLSGQCSPEVLGFLRRDPASTKRGGFQGVGDE